MPSRLRFIFALDITLLLSTIALGTVSFTGMIIHEWLGIAIALLALIHLLLSWTWVSSATQRLFSGASSRARINYILNALLFACMAAVIYSGIVISEYAIPTLTKQSAPDPAASFGWSRVHDFLSNAAVILVALHLAINWDWLAAAVRKILGRSKAAAA
jgi:cytochrome b561